MGGKRQGLGLSKLWIANIFKGSPQKLFFLCGVSVLPLPGKKGTSESQEELSTK